MHSVQHIRWILGTGFLGLSLLAAPLGFAILGWAGEGPLEEPQPLEESSDRFAIDHPYKAHWLMTAFGIAFVLSAVGGTVFQMVF